MDTRERKTHAGRGTVSRTEHENNGRIDSIPVIKYVRNTKLDLIVEPTNWTGVHYGPLGTIEAVNRCVLRGSSMFRWGRDRFSLPTSNYCAIVGTC